MNIVLVIKSLFGLKAGKFDIETAFLYGELYYGWKYQMDMEIS
jgi:hypothetical protein